ncbi:MAG: hypothetical protein JOZ08_12670 [Verrucomicrobia bacterium]|nr:hypothetical protein [Verrucomicrobiota bacterium]
MIADIKRHLEAAVFVPFSIEMNDGRSIRVPSRDHIGVLIHAVAVEDDTGGVRVLAARNISRLTIPVNGREG